MRSSNLNSKKNIIRFFIVIVIMVVLTHLVTNGVNKAERFTQPELATYEIEKLKGNGCWKVLYDNKYETNVCISRGAIVSIQNGELSQVLAIQN